MNATELLSELAFFQGLPAEVMQRLGEASEVVVFESDQAIVRQHDVAHSVHFLLSGSIAFSLRIESADDLYVGATSRSGSVVGWSAFRAPYRYTATVRAQQSSTFLRIPRSAIEAEVRADPALGYQLLCRVVAAVADRLDRAAPYVSPRTSSQASAISGDASASDPRPELASPLDVLNASPFFDSFDRFYVKELADHAEILEFDTGQRLFSRGDDADRVFVLRYGKVDLDYDSSYRLLNIAAKPGGSWRVRIEEPGRVIGWSALVAPYEYRATARASEPTEVLSLDRSFLHWLADRDPRFGITLMQRVLWVLGNRLRETRTRQIAQRYDDVVLAVRSLIEQNAERLGVASPLRKIPVYLTSRLTLRDAFDVLDGLRTGGVGVERRLAGVFLDLMRDVRRELEIYQRLQNIYQHVVGSGTSSAPDVVRQNCCEEFQQLFERTDYIIRGQELLPAESGCLFIMNHLENHLENRLPNEFILTLDTHFVSSMIVYPKYGKAPVRVIRRSGGDEYAHQMYYDRLGYIYVASGSVDPEVAPLSTGRTSASEKFLVTASAQLRGGTNIVICPEGNSTDTENSPLPFRSGAFRLAAAADPEPLIVPIAVANFDKKLTSTTLVAVVHQPFRISSHIGTDPSPDALREFVRDYQQTFHGYVQEARALGLQS